MAGDAGSTTSLASELVSVVSLLGAGVLAVPIFKRLGLGSVLGYLAAGLAIGPWGLQLFNEPGAILHIAELGVVMFLFIIGLEMQPSRLWGLRGDIFGLGAAQVAICGLLLMLFGMAIGFPIIQSFVAGMGFVLTSTAIVMQLLEEKGEMATQAGQRMISILLLEDLAIVPLLAIVAFLAPSSGHEEGSSLWTTVGIAVAALGGLVIAGRYLLNPMFQLLAAAHAREVMTAAALLVVFGAALAMDLGGLSMAMGAFLAGVLLSESTFRHQLEADIEPFRGILLGLFFMGVGMSLDLGVLTREWQLIAASVVGYMVLKSIGIYTVARFLRSSHREALMRAVYMAQGGEFAFVLYAAATSVGIFDADMNAALTATIIISMALTPLMIVFLPRFLPPEEQSLEGIEVVDGLSGNILIIGFGRFGQIASQPLILRGADVSIIDNDVEMIQVAGRFGFKVYYGDGTRLDILHAAGADKAQAVLICVDKADAAVLIAEHLKANFPMVPVFARAFDRGAALKLVHAGVEYQLRETLESALTFSTEVLQFIGVPYADAAETIEEVRRRDQERFAMQLAGDIYSGSDLFKGNQPVPAPVATPKRAGKALNKEAEDALRGGSTETEGASR
ncbi:monovalent cation:proton antiporter-2 (CPA2) family protein [Mesorhizobium sp. J428]|uniref:monovalent cation:proton antiporter-2 (CPA2) family protein n=1 Tax=Mesorhizobium sp. J428 TaxID=2898440 RepID=UPI002150C70E|nr:monovalent cation:proton antiporter-2 (CPA2) family protein [Mesorhizobium sp. J428]MCR5859675.1 monovalent cation:proton antiporter-2 (CPA2) family protein [Mesorhizobium sp. J428]